MPFVLDSSITMAWCFNEPNPYAQHVLGLLSGDEALVPPIWALEVANVVLVGERSGRLDEARTARFLNLLRTLPITVDMVGPERILSSVLSLARVQTLSSYDAAYLELAMRDGIPIATGDDTLRAAAARVGVSLVPAEGE